MYLTDTQWEREGKRLETLTDIDRWTDNEGNLKLNCQAT